MLVGEGPQHQTLLFSCSPRGKGRGGTGGGGVREWEGLDFIARYWCWWQSDFSGSIVVSLFSSFPPLLLYLHLLESRPQQFYSFQPLGQER